MELRVADMSFVLDELKAAVQSSTLDKSWFISGIDSDAISSVLGMIDISKIGVMGHSLGGATAVAIGRERSDVSAVIDIDGTMLSEYTGVIDNELEVRDEPYDVPVLEFVNWNSYSLLPEYRKEGKIYPNDVLIRNAAEGFSATLRDTRHMDFTDLPLLSPTLANLLGDMGSGDRSTEESMMIVNSLVLKFFNCYLKGEGTFTAQDIY